MAATQSAICVQSPVGWLQLEATGHLLSSVRFIKEKSPSISGPYVFARLIQDLEAYFSGRRQTFREPLIWPESSFAKKVLQTLVQVPYGTTLSYGTLAKRAGFPGAARAVGSVMAQNNIPLLIPCHRVVLSSGKLGNYTPGPTIKQILLTLEGSAPN